MQCIGPILLNHMPSSYTDGMLAKYSTSLKGLQHHSVTQLFMAMLHLHVIDLLTCGDFLVDQLISIVEASIIFHGSDATLVMASGPHDSNWCYDAQTR